MRREVGLPAASMVVITAVMASALGAREISAFAGDLGSQSGRLITFGLVGLALQWVAVDVYGRGAISFASTGMLAAAFAIDPGAGMAVALIAAAARFVTSHGRLYRAVFDGADLMLATGLAGIAYHALAGAEAGTAGRLGASIVAAAVFYAVNVGLLAGVMALAEGTSPVSVWRERFRWLAPYGVAAGPLACAMVIAYDALGIEGVLVFALPPAFMMLAVRQYLAHTRAGVEELRRVNAELSDANARLAASEEHFRSLIEDATDGIAVLDGGAKLLYASPAFGPSFGRPAEELAGTSALAAIPAGEHPAVLRMLERAIADEPVVPRELVLELPGRTAVLELAAHRLRGGRFGAAAVVTVRDVSARKQAEAELAQSREELRTAQKFEALGRLAGGVAHDFNNLLTVIGGCAELLLLRLGAEDVGRKEATEISNAAMRAATLTRQLLTFSRRQVIDRSLVDLGATVAGLAPTLERLMSPGVELVVETDRSRPVSILAEPAQVEQVVLNLVVNARDAVADSGRVAVSVRSVTVAAGDVEGLPEGVFAVLEVADDGCGIDEAVREHIFEPFFTTKRAGEGTGLGLATVYGAVRQVGGVVALESQLGAGSTFRAYFPQSAAELPAPDPQQEPETPASHATVLVVEDEDAVKRYVVTALEASGYRVLDAADEYVALQLLESGAAVDVLLSDVVMPELGGVELSRRARAISPGLPVILMSGHIGAVAVHEHCDFFVAKPFGMQELLSAIARVLEPIAA